MRGYLAGLLERRVTVTQVGLEEVADWQRPQRTSVSS